MSCNHALALDQMSGNGLKIAAIFRVGVRRKERLEKPLNEQMNDEDYITEKTVQTPEEGFLWFSSKHTGCETLDAGKANSSTARCVQSRLQRSKEHPIEGMQKRRLENTKDLSIWASIDLIIIYIRQ